jgi:hypothetical protein
MTSLVFLQVKLRPFILLITYALRISKMWVFTATTFLALIHYATATLNVTSRTAPVGAKVLTVAVIGGPYTSLHTISKIDQSNRLWMDWLASIA